MKISIEITDFWLEGEELSEALKAHVTDEVIRAISKEIKDKVETQITKQVREKIEQSMATQITTVIDEIIATGEVESSQDRQKKVSISEYILEKFRRDSGWSSASSQIEKLAKEFAAELKAQHGLQFATLIVNKLKENDLLKDGVADLLLDKGKGEGK